MVTLTAYVIGLSRIVLIFALSSICYAADLQIRFIGNEAFEITDGKITLLTDFPYRSGYSGYMEYDFHSIRPKGKALCLITHGHADHFELSLFQKTECAVFAPKDVLAKVEPSSVSSRQHEFGFGDMQIQALETPHAKIGHYSYLVSWKGKRFYFTGDTESPDTLLRMKNLDVAFVTPWLLSGLREQGKEVDAKRIVIYHQSPAEKVELCKNCTMMKQGQIFTLSGFLKQ